MATAAQDVHRYAANPAELPGGTLVELFFQALDRFDRPDALRWRAGAADWRGVSHAELLARVRGTALGLAALGLERGDRVAILSENRPEWAQADWAALCAGLISSHTEISTINSVSD
jgi:long-chain acyl-CoA synthetase